MSFAQKKGEVLAPAGSFAMLEAAVKGGADAVYLGFGEFNARRNAKNFDESELCRAIEYCHANAVKVYVALNTLLFYNEITSALSAARTAYNAGADAFIVQDLGLASLIKTYFPDVLLHASTQLSVHNASGAKMMHDLGFCRVVLARELSLKEIRRIAKEVPDIELEVFVHGALCYSLSGQCRFSAFLGGRSGNRGLCAQTCRLPFSCSGREYALSLKDQSLIGYIGELSRAGVCSFKIEGRMKRPEYAAITSRIFRKAVDGESVTDEELGLARSAFSRSGFTDGYIKDERNADMFGTRVREDTADSASAFSRINELTRNVYPRFCADMTLNVKEGEKISLVAEDKSRGITVTVYGDVPEAAKSPADRERIAAQMKKTGGTPYICGGANVNMQDGLYVSASAINSLRREAIERLCRHGMSEKRNGEMPKIDLSAPDRSEEPLTFDFRFENFSQIPQDLAPSRVILPLFEILSHEKEAKDCLHELCAELPLICFIDVTEKLKKAAALNVKYAVCQNVGQIKDCREANMPMLGGFGLNIANPLAANVYRDHGLKNITAAVELTFKQISAFAQGGDSAIIYGRIPLMVTRACPNTTENGCAGCKHAAAVTDRKGESFPIVCRTGCSEILNSVPIWLADRLSDVNAANITRATLYFTTETRQEAQKIINDYRVGALCEGKFTRGLYYRGCL